MTTNISSIKLTTYLVSIKSLSNSFIMAWNVAGKFIKPKNIIVGSNNSSDIVKTTFHLSLSFILILL